MIRALYALLRLLNDVNAVANGKAGQRVARRAVGKVTGRSMGRWLR